MPAAGGGQLTVPLLEARSEKLLDEDVINAAPTERTPAPATEPADRKAPEPATSR